MDQLAAVRSHKTKNITTQLISLDVSELPCAATELPLTVTKYWERRGRVVGCVDCTISVSQVCLDHVQVDGRRGSTSIALTTTRPHFGGKRRWFVCPNCGRRCSKVYLRSSFVCRTCAKAVYPSQYAYLRVAGEAKAKTARSRLGIQANFGIVDAQKPKGMHWKTYQKLEQLIWDADIAFDDFIFKRM